MGPHEQPKGEDLWRRKFKKIKIRNRLSRYITLLIFLLSSPLVIYVKITYKFAMRDGIQLAADVCLSAR